jgi:hypothetical protein
MTNGKVRIYPYNDVYMVTCWSSTRTLLPEHQPMARRQRLSPACRAEGDVFDILRFVLDPGAAKGFMDA